MVRTVANLSESSDIQPALTAVMMSGMDKWQVVEASVFGFLREVRWNGSRYFGLFPIQVVDHESIL